MKAAARKATLARTKSTPAALLIAAASKKALANSKAEGKADGKGLGPWERSDDLSPTGSRHVSIESASLRSAADQALASQAEVSRSRRASSESLGGKASAKAESMRAELRAEVLTRTLARARTLAPGPCPPFFAYGIQKVTYQELQDGPLAPGPWTPSSPMESRR